MSLQSELHRVREYLANPSRSPSNEASTCQWAIVPLLYQCGYNHHDILPQVSDASKGIPDYTILPGTAFTWYLEAKGWSDKLLDIHVIQAINYAHTTGKRWAVLSNGQEWRLYDDHIVGVQPADRLVAVARLDCGTELESLLSALSKSSVESDGVGKYALQTRLRAILGQQLQTPGSEIIKALTGVLKSKFALSNLQNGDVLAYFYQPTSTPPILPLLPTVPQKPAPLTSTSVSKILTLTQLQQAGLQIQGKKPALLTLPDKSVVPIASWTSLTISIVGWLSAGSKMPNLPFRGRKTGKSLFLSSTSYHSDGNPMRKSKELPTNGLSLFIDVHRSAPDLIYCLCALCDAVSEPTSGFEIEIQ